MWHRLSVALNRFLDGAGVVDRRHLSISARVVLLMLCGGLSFVEALRPNHSIAAEFSRFGLLVAVSVVAIALARARPSARSVAITESIAVTATVMADGGPHEPLFPYLLAPALEAGLVVGTRGAIAVAGASSAIVLLARISGVTERSLVNYSTTAAEWVTLALLVGLLAAWARRLGLRATSIDQPYSAAYRLMTQLRTVSRHLSAGLDAVSLARMLLQSLRAVAGYERAAVVVPGPAGALIPLVREGELPNWDTSLDGVAGEAWNQQRAVTASRAASGSPNVASLAMPLIVGARTVGLVVMEREAEWQPQEVAALVHHLEEPALRIETAMLFGEVRAIATAEERKRLAREIHDGIAQELAFMGYVVDDLRARCQQADVAEELAELRAQVTRVVGDLRLSIFELRSEVEQRSGLGALLSDFVRSVGAASRLTVHLALDESPYRLPLETEAELLRIAQEAINNARKHAGADNLWVTCVVAPPAARLVIEDDGRGMRPGRKDSYGLEIMRERASRLGADLHVGARVGGGTRIEVVLGEQPEKGTREDGTRVLDQ